MYSLFFYTPRVLGGQKAKSKTVPSDWAVDTTYKLDETKSVNTGKGVERTRLSSAECEPDSL